MNVAMLILLGYLALLLAVGVWVRCYVLGCASHHPPGDSEAI
jgi:hypothetical protein